MASSLVTYTGKVFDLLNPKPEMVCIEDIAHALANLCRYTGHVSSFYSVAQHCVLMAENPDLPGDPLAKLLHDAAEAYTGDMASPWKSILRVDICDAYYETAKAYEGRIQKVIETALGIGSCHSKEIKLSDTRILWTEIRDLMPEMSESFEWGPPIMEPLKEIIVPWIPDYAEQAFLECYNELMWLRNTGD